MTTDVLYYAMMLMLFFFIFQVAATFLSSRICRDNTSLGSNYGSYIYDTKTAMHLIERNMPHFL